MDVFAAARREEKFSPGDASKADHVSVCGCWGSRSHSQHSKLLCFGTPTRSAQPGRTYISRIMHLTFQPVENLLGTVKTNRLEKSANYPLPPSGHSSAATPLRAILEAISTCCHSLPGQRSEVWWPHQGAFTARPGTKWVTNVWPWGMSWNLRHLQFDRTLRWLLIKQILMQGLLCWQLVGETEIHRFLTWFSFFGCMRRHNPVLPSHCPHWEELHS